MNTSPLLLEKIFFKKIHLDLGFPEGQESGKPPFHYDLDSVVDFKQRGQEVDKFVVTLTVEIKRADEGITPFVGEIIAEGYFSVHESMPKDRWIEVVTANGAAVLFGMIREFITNLSARSLYPILTLPSVNFVDDAIRVNEEVLAKQAAMVEGGAVETSSDQVLPQA